jgi:hypothetical protein
VIIQPALHNSSQAASHLTYPSSPCRHGVGLGWSGLTHGLTGSDHGD